MLPNTGLLMKQLPEEIFSDIKHQVSLPNLEPMISGMSSVGVPKHYYLNDSKPLRDYITNAFSDFFKEYAYALDFKLRSDGVEPNAKVWALEPWINYQKKNEWIPAHDHSGIMSYSLWVNIPEDNVFEIIYSTISGETIKHAIPVTRQSEGMIILFPSKLIHTVHPFYTSEETRISISGNIILK
jgi:hypothetical protein